MPVHLPILTLTNLVFFILFPQTYTTNCPTISLTRSVALNLLVLSSVPTKDNQPVVTVPADNASYTLPWKIVKMDYRPAAARCILLVTPPQSHYHNFTKWKCDDHSFFSFYFISNWLIVCSGSFAVISLKSLLAFSVFLIVDLTWLLPTCKMVVFTESTLTDLSGFVCSKLSLILCRQYITWACSSMLKL